jgi:WD40 repeat protein
MNKSHQNWKDDKRISVHCIRTYIGHTGNVEFVAFGPEGRTIISGGDDHTLRTWESNTGACTRISKFDCWSEEHNSFAITSDGKLALVGSMYKESNLFDVETGRCVRTFEHCGGYPISVAISPDDKYAVSGNWESIGLWDLKTGQCLRVFKLKSDVYVKPVAFFSDTRFAIFAFAGDDSSMQLWNMETGKPIRQFEGHTDYVNSVSISEDGRYAASGSDDKRLRLWEVGTGKCLMLFEGHNHCVDAVAVSPDGGYILSGGTDHTVRLWDTMTGECLSVLSGHEGGVKSVAFSSDGEFGLSGSIDETIKLWALHEDTN